MKSNRRTPLAACLQALILLVTPCVAAPEGGCEMAVAALNLPGNSTGLLHWRAADTATTPLQLSTRYFSERLKVPGRVIQFFEQPLAADAVEPLPLPLLTLTLPADTSLAYVVLRSEAGEDGAAAWKASVLRGEEWKEGSLKVLNACPEPVGIAAGERQIPLASGKAIDFHAKDWRESFPVKIYRAKPTTKLVFSSTWRVTAGRRELCLIGGTNGAVTLRSLLELDSSVPKESP